MKDFDKVKQDLGLNDDEISSHETDLYVKDSQKAREYFKKYGYSHFISQLDGVKWLDIPFYLLDDKIRNMKK